MNEELLKKLKTAKTPEELGELLKAAGVEAPADKLKEIFNAQTSGELRDDDLARAAGGTDDSSDDSSDDPVAVFMEMLQRLFSGDWEGWDWNQS